MTLSPDSITREKKMLSLLLAFCLVLGLLPLSLPVCAIDNANLAVTLGNETNESGTCYYRNAAVMGNGIKTILLSFSESVAAGDKIVLPAAPDGFVVSSTSESNDYTKRINIDSGADASTVQGYLQGIGFQLAGSSQSVKITITTESIQYDTFYDVDTQHYYQYIPYTSPAGTTWVDAYNTARGLSYMDRTGYLATVTSYDEDVFLNSLSGGKVGWLGGTALDNTGADTDNPLYFNGFDTDNNAGGSDWYWACGPERGQTFYYGRTPDRGTNTGYWNWGSSEPNGYASGENSLTTLIRADQGGIRGTNFSWNDITWSSTYGTDEFSPKGCFVEYGNLSLGSSETVDAAKYASDSGSLSSSNNTASNFTAAQAPDNGNYVHLNWTGTTGTKFMVSKSDSTGAGAIFQTIPLKTTIKVLNVYPDNNNGLPVTSGSYSSDALRSWMDSVNSDTGNKMGSPYIQGTQYNMSVDDVALSVFNNSPETYLKKDNEGNYNYDVVFFGSWDSNGDTGGVKNDLSDTAKGTMDSFIGCGGGCLFGHDTVNPDSANTAHQHPNFVALATEYLNLLCNNSYYLYGDVVNQYGGYTSTIQVIKKGLLTNYPYQLSQMLTIPASHTTYQFAKGDVWMKFTSTNNYDSGNGPAQLVENNGTNNFYLTTWNNAAMIQTGHSCGQATTDEQELLTNTLYYLAQVSAATSFDDHTAQDLTAPNAVSGNIAASVGPDGKTTISFNAPTDNGNTYYYQLYALNADGTKPDTGSGTASAMVTTGVKGYYVLVDQSSDTPTAETVKASGTYVTTPSYTVDHELTAGTNYTHILTVDGAGNESAVTTASFGVAEPVAGSGSGLSFDVSNDYVDLGESNSKLVLGNTYTEEAWIYFAPTGNSSIMDRFFGILGNDTGIANSDTPTRAPSVWVYQNGRVHAGFGDGSNWCCFVTPDNVVTSGVWNHVAVVYNGSAFYLYINGVLKYQETHTATPYGTPVRYIGKAAVALGDEFNGRIDEVKIWKTARTQDEIKQDMYSHPASGTSGLTGYWSFDEDSGSMAADSSGNGNNGTLINADTSSCWVDSGAWRNRMTAQDTPLAIDAGYAPGGGAVTLASTSDPTHGTLEFDNDNKTVKYTPNSNYYGSDSFTYTLTANSVCKSYTVNMTVVQAPIITGPSDVTAAEGTAAAFSIVAEADNGILSYQWQKYNGSTWSNIESATGATYTIDSVSANDAGQYRCVATNTDGGTKVTTISSMAALTVTFVATVNIKQDGLLSGAPVTGSVELKQGENTIAALTGSSGTYAANVSNGTYDIFADGVDTNVDIAISDAANNATVNYYTVSFSAMDNGAASGSSVTAMAGGAAISSGDAILAGKKVVLTATGAGADSYTYLWSGEGTNSQTTASLTIDSLNDAVNAICAVTGSASYTVTLNKNGGTVNNGNVTAYSYGIGAALPMDVTRDGYVFGGWYAAPNFSGNPVTDIGNTEKDAKEFWSKWVQNPIIGTQPESRTVAAGSAAAFSVTVSEPTSGVSYLWQKYSGSTWNTIDSATNATYAISSVAADDAGQYRCVVTNTDGDVTAQATSDAVSLGVSHVIVVTNDDSHGSGSAGDDGSTVTSALPGEEITLTAAPDNGYHFLRWDVVSGSMTITDNKFTMPAKPVEIKAVFEINTYAATVNIKTDGSNSNAPEMVELKQSGSTMATLAGSDGIYTASVVNGTYDVYVNGEDTEADLTINEAPGNAEVNYYTVSFSASDAGAVSGSTVTATADGTAISSGAAVLAGEKVVLTAIGAGTSYYSYLWSGSGAEGGTSVSLTILSLSSKVDALCTVTGRTSPTVYSVSLDTNGGTIDNGSIAFYTYGVGAKLPVNVTRPDSVFIGWFADETFSGSPVTEISATDTGDKTFYAKWNYDIGGVISDDDGTKLHGATVTIRGNSITPKSTTTDIDGNYSFPDITPGEYNIVAFYNGVTKTIILRVTNKNITDANITMPAAGAENSVVTIAQGTPDVVVGYLDEQFSDDDDQYVANTNNTVKLELAVEEKSREEAIGAADIQAQAGNRTVDMYLDMKLTKTQTGTDPSNNQLSSVDSLLKIIIPYDLSGKINVVVYRVHEGTTEALTERPYSESVPSDECYMMNTAGNQVVVWARKFSTYAIAHSNIVRDSGGSSSSYAITSSAGTGGTISPSGRVSVTAGSSKTFTVTAQEGYAVSDVLVDGRSVGAVGSYTFSSISANHTIQAVFASSADGLPYYIYNGSKVFIGFASNAGGTMKYIAPKGETVLFQENPKNFMDIAGHWGKLHIDFVTEREIFIGTASNIFSPDTGMTRAMFAAIIGRLYERSYGGLEAANTKHAFTDVNYNDYYGKYVDWESENNIIDGIGGGHFDPDREITREEMATILYRFAEFMGVSTAAGEGALLSSPDASSISSWAADAARYCQQTEIIVGRDNGYFVPQGTAARAEVSAVFERFIELVVK